MDRPQSDESGSSTSDEFESLSALSSDALLQNRLNLLTGALTEGDAARLDGTAFRSDSTFLYRFLKSVRMDVPSAVEAVEASLSFREKREVDRTVLPATRSLPQKDFPFARPVTRYWPHLIHHGKDRRGRPLSIERLGLSNPRALCHSVTLDQLVVYHLHHMEHKRQVLCDESVRLGQVVRSCKIIDLHGLSRHHLTTSGLLYLKTVLGISQTHYPEFMGKLFIINAPYVFNIAWKVVKPILNEATLEKIHILDAQNYQKILQEHIPLEHLPREFGGTCHCNGGAGPTGSGPCVPIYNIENELRTEDIKAGQCFVHSIEIQDNDVPGTTWRVEVQVKPKEKDIGMELRFKSKHGTEKVLLPMTRHSNAGVYTDEVTLNEYGTVSLVLDNSFSRFTSKVVFWDLNVEKLTSEEVQLTQELETVPPLCTTSS